jgi:hypothetical protein
MLGQGNEYQSLHEGQHGGAASFNTAPAPPGYTGVLEDGLRGQAFLNPLDQSVQAIQGMSDQAGGRRRGGRKGKGTRRGRKNKKTRRGRMRGGAAVSLAGAQDFGAPGMLLSPGQEAAALGGMNPEWKLASDPNAFTPR